MARPSKVAGAKKAEHSAAQLNIDIQIELWPIEREVSVKVRNDGGQP